MPGPQDGRTFATKGREEPDEALDVCGTDVAEDPASDHHVDRRKTLRDISDTSVGDQHLHVRKANAVRSCARVGQQLRVGVDESGSSRPAANVGTKHVEHVSPLTGTQAEDLQYPFGSLVKSVGE